MRLTLLICLLFAFQSIAIETFSQNQRLSINQKNIKIEDIIQLIENKTDYYFMYSVKTIDVERTVNIEAKDKFVSEILDNIFNGTSVSYKIHGRLIALSKSGEESAIGQQPHSVSGKVTESSGASMPGVAVVVKGTTIGTTTDSNGNFTLSKIPDGAILQFSFVGMKTQEIQVADKTKIDVILAEEAIGLDEVVAIGYGTQKKENITGSVASISSEKLAAVPAPNVSSLLYGRLPGLVAIQRSGEPGLDDVSLSIRGFENALVVVDGIVGRDFTRLDPNEIESVTILKDAASSAVYGVSGGNGVILVTTKKGNIGKPVFNYSIDYGAQTITKYPKGVNSEEFAILKNESAVNLGGVPVYSQEEIQKFRLGTEPGYPNFDYFHYMVRDFAPQMQQNITVRGGSEKIKYFFLLGETSQASMWKGGDQDYTKYNFRSNVDATINDNLGISVDFGSRIEDRNNLTQNSFLMAAWLQYQSPIYTPKTPDGHISTDNYGLTAYLDKDLSGYVKDKRNVYEGTLTVNYKVPFITGMKLSLKASHDMYFHDEKAWMKKYDMYSWDETTQTSTKVSSRGSNDLTVYNWNASESRIQTSLNYERTFGKNHNIKGLFLYEVSDSKATNFYASRTNYVLPIDQLFAGPDAGKSNYGGAADTGRESYVGRVNYDYLGKYLFEYSFRFDGSAKFPPDKRWGYFSGISSGWRISEESFIKDNFHSIDNLKLRGSWGNLGSDNTGNFQYLTGYSYPYGNYIFGGGTVSSGMIDMGIPNPNITWEESQIFDIGVDLSLWKRLLEIEADVYYRKREGLLATRVLQLPSTFGATLPAENLNSDNARGFEISLSHSSTIGEVRYKVSTNVSFSRMKNDHVEQRTFNNQYDNWRNNNEDRWSGLYWGYKAIGQFQSMDDIYSSAIQDARANSTLRPGDIKYDDFNKDGVIDEGDYQIIGRGFSSWEDYGWFYSPPLVSYSLGINAIWKNLTVDMNWTGSTGSNLEQTYDMIAPFKDGRSAFSFFLDRWHREDPLDPNSAWIPGKYPATIVNGATNNLLRSSFWMKDVSYIRLKSLNISYNIESETLKRIGVENLSLSLSGLNLLTFSSLGPIDPETKSSALSYYPQQKTYNVGISVTF